MKFERICSGCKKVEMVATEAQLSRKCRSCSKKGNTSSQNMSKEARQKIADAKKNSIPWNKGLKDIYSKETRILMGANKKGKPLKNETKQKISQGLKETYKTQPSSLKGKELTKEHKLKIQKSLENIPEHLKSAANLNRSIKNKINWQNRSKEDLQKQYGKIAQKLIKYTNNNLWDIFTEYSIIPLFDIPKNDDLCSISGKVQLKCKCGGLWQPLLAQVVKTNGCRSCGCERSFAQKKLQQFLIDECAIAEDLIITNSRPEFMNGLELDIFIPSKNFAIEYHGLAWHSERPLFGPKDLHKIRTQHETKYLLAKEAGITLFQIFEDEWRDKSELIQAMLKARLGLLDTKINARDCILQEVPSDIAKTFFENNHIAGATPGLITLGLYLENELIAALSLRKTWNKAYGDNILEIARFASKAGLIIRGGFAKLCTAANVYACKGGYSGILTYADCRFGTGAVYVLNGFHHVGKTKPNYYYENFGIRENRFKHRKSSTLSGNTERDQQNALGWYAIYDAGSEIYLRTF